MKSWKKIIIALLGLSCLFGSYSARANECLLESWDGFDYRTVFENQVTSTCLHLENNQSSIGTEVRRLLQSPEQDARVAALEAMDRVQDFLELSFDRSDTPQAENATRLHQAIQLLKQSVMANPLEPEAGIKDRWKLGSIDEDLPDDLAGLDFKATLTAPECADVKSGNCDEEFHRAIDIVQSIILVNAALDKYTEDYRASVYADRKLRRIMWDSYYDDLTFQFPWEMLVNNLVLDATDDRVEIDGNKMGFRPLPRSKLVLLHPEVSLVYAEDAGEEYDVALTVELLGYEGFDFNDKSGKVEDSWGISLLGAYLPRTDRDESDWTAGLLLKYEGYSLGVTDNHGDLGVIFNINLSQRIFEVKQEHRRYFDELGTRLDTIRTSLE